MPYRLERFAVQPYSLRHLSRSTGRERARRRFWLRDSSCRPIVFNNVDNLPGSGVLSFQMPAAPFSYRGSQNPKSLAIAVERAVSEWIFKGELTAGQKLTEH